MTYWFHWKSENLKFISAATLGKFIKTKHSGEDHTNFDHLTDENVMFQINIVENEIVFACNICDPRFLINEEVKNIYSWGSSGYLKLHPDKIYRQKVMMVMRMIIRKSLGI